MSFSEQFLVEIRQIAEQLNQAPIERIVSILVEMKDRGGRLFVLGVGGSAANASHAVNDFRKIAGIEAYAPTDNMAELTARTNDDGWESVFEAWLQGSRLDSEDVLLIFSVGGGDIANHVSTNLISALRYAKETGARVIGVVGRSGGVTAEEADACVIVPMVNPEHVTPHSETFQAVIWHLLVSHPALKAAPTKWESLR